MSSFWGLNETGQVAKDWLPQYGNISKANMNNWLANQNQWTGQGNELFDVTKAWNQQALNTGFGTTADTRSTGGAAMPGVEDANKTAAQRWQDIYNQYKGITPASTVAKTVNDNLDTLKGQIYANRDVQQGLANQGYGDALSREQAYHGDIINNMEGVYGALGSGWNNAYSDMTANVAKTYGDLLKSSSGAYDTAGKQLEILKPGGEAAAAAASRGFAPAMASTLSRLRASGVDPNSPEAASLLRGVDTARARAMDDQLMAATEKYISSKNALTLGGEQAKEGLTTTGLNTGLGLGQAQIAGTTQLGQQGLAAVTGEKLRNLDATQQLSLQKMAADSGISSDTLSKVTDWLGQKNNAALLDKALQTQDAGQMAQVLQGMNQNDIQALQLMLQQFQAGEQFTGLDLSQRNLAAGNLQTLGQNTINNALNASRTAQGWGTQATDAYDQAYKLAAQNAGWGTKMLMGVAPGALNLLVPGLGTAVGGFMNAGGLTGPSSGYGNTGWANGGGGSNTVSLADYYKKMGF